MSEHGAEASSTSTGRSLRSSLDREEPTRRALDPQLSTTSSCETETPQFIAVDAFGVQRNHEKCHDMRFFCPEVNPFLQLSEV